MKMNADELAAKLEQKARQLRENGLTQEDLDKAAGGGHGCICCGTTCTNDTSHCISDDPDGYDHPEGCKNSCIASSPD